MGLVFEVGPKNDVSFIWELESEVKSFRNKERFI